MQKAQEAPDEKVGAFRMSRPPRWLTRKRFHLARLAFWVVQIPPAVTIPAVRESVPYLVFLSLAALVESAGTDYDQARKDEQEADDG